MSGIEYYVCDLETTGLNSTTQETVEISIIRCSDRVQLTEFIRAEKPETASYDALRITGKTLADLQKGNSKESVVEKVEAFFQQDGLTPAHRCIIGHNIISFDKRFIHALYEKCNRSFPANLWLDTVAMTKQLLKKTDPTTLQITKTATGKTSTQLHACCDMFEVKKISGAHASKVDSQNTYLLWKKLMEKGVDHLPLIKTFEHNYNRQPDVEDLLAALDQD